MPSFKDASGEKWEFEVNLESIDRVIERNGTNLCSVLDNNGALLQALANDERLLCGVLGALTQRHNELEKVFVGDTIDKAYEALWEGLAAFFPSRKRKIMEAMRKQSEALDELNEKTVGRLTNLSLTELVRLQKETEGLDRDQMLEKILEFTAENGSTGNKRTKNAGK